MKERIFINIFSHNVGRFFEMFLGLLLVPFLIKVLGAVGFGLIIFMESVILFFEFTFIGLRSALGRYAGISFFQDNKNEANDYFSTAQGILIGIILVIAIIGATFWYWFPVFFKVPLEFVAQMKVFIPVMFLSFIVRVYFTSRWTVIYSFQRFDLINIYEAFRNIIRCLLVFAVYLIFSPKLYYYGFIYFGATLIEQIFVVRGARKLFPELLISMRKFSWQRARELASFMGFRTIGSIAAVLYIQTDMLLINRFFGPYFNALYSISYKFVNTLKRLIQQSLWLLTPSFTELVARKENERISRIYTSMTKATTLVTLPICILLALFGKELIILWVGQEFIAAIHPMYIHIIAATPLLIFTASDGIATSHAKIKVPSLVGLVCAVGNVFISLFCALKLGWGLVGFAFGTLCAHFVLELIFKPCYTCRIIKISCANFYYKTFLKPLMLSGTIGFIIYYFKFLLNMPLGYLLIWLAVSFVIYFYISYIWILTSYEKHKAKEIIARAFTVIRRK